jgi:hypothetical protein
MEKLKKIKCPECKGELEIYVTTITEYGDNAYWDEAEIECINPNCDFIEIIINS